MAQGFLRKANGEFETIDVQQSRWTFPTSINDKGVVAGWYIPEQGNSPDFGFIRSPSGKITTFVAPGAVSGTNVSSINKAGTVIGTYYPGDNFDMARAYIRTSGGTFTTFDVSGYYTEPASLNAKNTVVGSYSTQGNKGFGFLRKSDGSFKKIRIPGASSTSAIGINSNGIVVGNYSVRTGRHAYLSYGFIRTP